MNILSITGSATKDIPADFTGKEFLNMEFARITENHLTSPVK
jgi:hypothetical protein